jgi:hypothetical protein
VTEHCEFQASLGYMVRPVSKKKGRKKGKKGRKSFD